MKHDWQMRRGACSNLNIKLIKATWGMDRLTLREQFIQIGSSGIYKGIECPLPVKEQENEFRELLEEYQLEYIPMIFTGGQDHLASFQIQMEQAAKYEPNFINAHSAKDSMPYEELFTFFEQALRIEDQLNIPVGHETHRGRALYTPWITARLLKDLPELKITADFSHWCCVCESLLEDHEDSLKLAFERTIHIHARVGYAQGPQVPHPAAPEYQQELAVHENWWKQIIQHWENKKLGPITVTPEFGPPGYMHTLPFTNQPVSDLWDVCRWMANRLLTNE
jgi:hypothetical protein